jgi:hypothetical protein
MAGVLHIRVGPAGKQYEEDVAGSVYHVYSRAEQGQIDPPHAQHSTAQQRAIRLLHAQQSRAE